ncbi:hypothetical protein QZH56_15510 [Streptomyces olivoreticuli]|uniref:hypothetical protein n=1 Tax=Streptomyces olivoreticuli TaxID=68246 RepID=UPI00265841E1|nr:hypothetical protein [Streptomyces olivoreticuli]WKK26874.1 hypothetical protein QZH56_15510 [Streptomyces olivoreticuli]
MTVRSAWHLPLGQTREDTRLTPLGVMAPSGEMTSRDGVIAGGQPFAAAGISPMQVQIGVGRAIVQGTVAQGAYPVAVTAPETLTITDGDPQYARIDSIALRILDPGYDTSQQALARVEIIQGAPTATPAPPAMPAAALRLWDISVPAGTSAGVGGINWAGALADRRRYTAAAGGIIPRGWGMSFPGAYDGQYRDNGGTLERWSAPAAAWQPYPYDSGWQPLTLWGGYGHPGHGMPAAWRRIGPLVMLRGRIGPTKTGSTIPNGATILTLPAGARPAGNKEFAWASPRDQSNKAPSVCRVEIQPGGNVRTYEFVELPQWVSLDGVTYMID